MAIKVGFVGLPNVGKSTLFNAVTKSSLAEAQNFPFCTIEPNVAITEVPDQRLVQLAKVFGSAKILFNSVKFVDIAGLVKGASKGEGLGNQFLNHIMEVDLIVHVLRCFEDSNIIHVSSHVDPLADFEIIMAELMLKDFDSLEKREVKLGHMIKKAKDAKEKDALQKEEVYVGQLKKAIEDFNSDLVRDLIKQARKQSVELIPLLSGKNFMVAANLSETDLQNQAYLQNPLFNKLVEKFGKDNVVPLSAQIESDLSQMSAEEQEEMRSMLQMDQAGLNKLILECYKNLGLISFFTCGPKEAHAWSVVKNATAPQAAGEIHSDLQKGFICAEVYNCADIIALGSEAAVKTAGKMRIEGKDYQVQDGDILNIRFNV